MKIVFCKGQFIGPVSGADEIIVNNAIQLKAAGHVPVVLLMYPCSQDDPFYVRLRKADVTVSAVGSAPVGASLNAGRKLLRHLSHTIPFLESVVRENGRRINAGVVDRYFDACCNYFKRCHADLIHVVTPDASAMVMIRAGHAVGVPVLYQEVGMPFHPPKFEAHYEKFTSVLPLCAGVAALSPRLAQMCREQLAGINAVSVLPIMVEDSIPSGHTTQGPSQDGVTFGFAARFEHLKGPMQLIEAFSAVSQKVSGLTLKMAGTGSLQQEIASRAETLGVATRCRFSCLYTNVEQRSAFMRGLDLFVLPSFTEGTPNGIVEAMAHGLPVIASAVGGVPDVVTEETGILVPPGEIGALADAMLRLAADSQLRARMGRSAVERYKTLFSPEAVLPSLLDTYRRTAAKGKADAVTTPNGNGHLHPWTHPKE